MTHAAALAPEETFVPLISVSGQPVPLQSVELDGRLAGLFTTWTLRQRFINVEKAAIEAVYQFPLADAATLTGASVTIGERVITCQIEEREKAFADYDNAIAAGDGAVLIDEERPNYFQISVGNILPDQELTVALTFIQPLSITGSTWRLMVPMTIAPRYTPSGLTHEERVEAERITPNYAHDVPYRLKIALAVRPGQALKAVSSPSHPIRWAPDADGGMLELAQTDVALDRDLVIEFEPAQAAVPFAIAANRHGRDHVLVQFVPIEDASSSSRLPLELIFVIDCSGSMEGPSIAQARKALEACLRQMIPGDRFNIIRFGNDWRVFSAAAVVFGPETLQRALTFLGEVQADLGGTEILAALQNAAGRSGNRTLILMTDGQANNEDHIIAWAAGERKRLRIFPFGIGAGASDYLIAGLARATGGQAEFIHPGERIEPKVLRQFNRISAPLLDEVRVEWGGLTVEAAPRELPPVFPDEPLHVAARLAAGASIADGQSLTLRARTSGGERAWTVAVSRNDEAGHVAHLWARWAIRDLEEHPDWLNKGSQQSRAKQQDRGSGALVAISREYGVLCRETSFIAVEQRPETQRNDGRPELRRVPVQFVHGWQQRPKEEAYPSLVLASPMAPRGFAGVAEPMDELMFSERLLESRSRSKLGTVVKALTRSISGICGFTAEPQPARAPKRKKAEEESERVFIDAEAPRQSPGVKSRVQKGKTENEDEQTDRILAILSLCEADGSFGPGSEFFQALEVPPHRFADLLAALGVSDATAERALATAIVLTILKRDAATAKDLWQGAARKAKTWLAGCGIMGPDGQPLTKWLQNKL